MTIEQLQEKQDKITNGIYQGQMRSYTNQHLTNLSIEYAIGILEEVKNNKTQGIITDESVYQKIHDLKSLLK